MAAASPPRGNESVLLVEPDPETRVLAAFMLRRLGYRVTEARSGVEAVRLHDAHGAAFDLLMAEAVMPRVTGHDVAGVLRGSRPDLRVVLLADDRYERDARRAATQSGITFLWRPFTMASLAAGVRDALDAARGHAAAAGRRH